MEEIRYKNRTIIPIMKPMLVWDDDEDKSKEAFIYVKEPENKTYPWVGRGLGGRAWACGWKNAKPLPSAKPRTIEDGLKVGDVIISWDTERKVLGVCDRIIFVSSTMNFNTIDDHYTIEDLINAGYSIKIVKDK